MDNETRKCVKYGGFSIQPFKVEHDVPAFGYYIQHKEMGKLLFVTDTSYVKYDFSKLKVNHIMVETNYSDELLADDVKRNHVLVGHMSVNNAYEFVKHNESPQLRNIILIHLSDSNGNKEKFLEQFSTFKNCNVYVAEKGLTVDLSECPF
jgi:phosphoribosyl 1,2-cyclic phosphodiesterase